MTALIIFPLQRLHGHRRCLPHSAHQAIHRELLEGLRRTAVPEREDLLHAQRRRSGSGRSLPRFLLDPFRSCWYVNLDRINSEELTQSFGSILGGVVGYAMTTYTEEQMPVIGFDMVRREEHAPAA